MKVFPALVILALLASAHAETGSGALTVNVRDLETDAGQLRFALFDSADDFMKKAVRAGIVTVEGRGGTWVVDDLPYGTYALTVHHDVDSDGEIEQHWYGKPKEPVGASNNPSARFGPPRFSNAKFELAAAQLTLDVVVK